MRLVLPTLAACLAAGLLGCSDGSRPAPPTPPEPFTPRGDVAASARLEVGNTLRDAPVEATADGPWHVRRTGGSESTGAIRESKGVARTLTGSRPAGMPAEDAAFEGGESEMDGGVIVGGAGGGSVGGRGGGGARPADGGVDAGDDAPPVASPASSPTSPAGPDGDVEGAVRATHASRFSGGGGAAPAQNLKAGATDDNADYDAYLEFLSTWVAQQNVRELFQPLDVSNRRFIRIRDAGGAPVPGAVVSVVDEAADRVLFTGTTYGDGRVAFYPHLNIDFVTVDVDAPRSLLVEAYLPGDGEQIGTRTEWDGLSAEIEIELGGAPALADPLQLDVCLLIDTTGSMADEIASIKHALLRMTQKLRSLDREFDLRYGAVLYRDIGDEYLTARHAFTSDVEAFDDALRSVQANGGGDGPESLNQGLAEAVTGVEWRPDAAKVVFLIADAQPHMDYAGDVPYGESLQAAVAKGIRVHSVAASGLNAVGTLVFRQIAQMTRGKFIFIEYGTTAASAESHGVKGAVKSNNLEDILFEQIRDELAMYGRE